MAQPRCLALGTDSSLVLFADAEGAPRLLKTVRHADKASKSRVRREIALLGAAADSDFTVGCHGWLSQPDRTEILLDYLPGGCLDTLLERNGALSASSARFYVACAAAALEFLHARDLVHRDVKPSNLLLNSNGHMKLGDFGSDRGVPSCGGAFTSSIRLVS